MKRKLLLLIIIAIILTTVVLAREYTQDYLDPLTKAIADLLYEPKQESFEIYLNTSMYNTVHWYINESDEDTYHFHVPTGKKFIIGDKIE